MCRRFSKPVSATTKLNMEEVHCSREDCNQLDFLPFKCQYCKEQFCLEHWKVEKSGNSGHKCTKYAPKDTLAILCPVCGKVVPKPPDADANIAVDQHLSRGCHDIEAPSRLGCNFKECRDKSLVPMVCQQCRRNYCTKHRLMEIHGCPPAAPVTRKNQSKSQPAAPNNAPIASNPTKKSTKKDCIVM